MRMECGCVGRVGAHRRIEQATPLDVTEPLTHVLVMTGPARPLRKTCATPRVHPVPLAAFPSPPCTPGVAPFCGHARGAPGLQVGHFLLRRRQRGCHLPCPFFKGVILTERGHLAAAEGLHLKGQQQPCCELSIAPRSDATLSTVGQSQYAQDFLEPRSGTGPLPLLMHHLYNAIDSSHSASTLEKT